MLKWGYVLLLAAAPCCLAQDAATSVRADAQETPAQPHTASDCCRLIDGTAVAIEIVDPLSSALLKRGDQFKIRLAEPVTIEGEVVIAAGIEGIGEVVHAERSRAGGKAGELLIAARYLDYRGDKVRLRGLKLGGAGKDNTGTALAVAIAAGPFALFVQGKEIVIPAGTRAQAKIAQETRISAADAPHAAATTAGITLAPESGPSPTNVPLPGSPITIKSSGTQSDAPAAVNTVPSHNPKE